MSTTEHWIKKHKEYEAQGWINKPSLFAETAISYFPKQGTILELGAGQGQDSRFFAAHGYHVVSTDVEPSALQLNRSKITQELRHKLSVQQLDLRTPFPFADASFDVVYAHLSLHYFEDATTRAIFKEIRRVLKRGGVLAFFTNSTNDPQYRAGEQLEPDFFQIDDITKRYFTPETAAEYAAGFTPELVDNQGETYKDAAKGVHSLIRFIGRKK